MNAGEQPDQGDDRQGRGAGRIEHAGDVLDAELGPAAQHVDQRQHHLADEVDRVDHAGPPAPWPQGRAAPAGSAARRSRPRCAGARPGRWRAAAAGPPAPSSADQHRTLGARGAGEAYRKAGSTESQRPRPDSVQRQPCRPAPPRAASPSRPRRIRQRRGQGPVAGQAQRHARAAIALRRWRLAQCLSPFPIRPTIDSRRLAAQPAFRPGGAAVLVPLRCRREAANERRPDTGPAPPMSAAPSTPRARSCTISAGLLRAAGLRGAHGRPRHAGRRRRRRRDRRRGGRGPSGWRRRRARPGRSRCGGGGDGRGVRALAGRPARCRRRSSAPAARATRRWWRPPCARCRWACPRSWSRPWRRATSRPMSARPTSCMIHSVTDVQGLNRISRRVLGNAAHALAGMMRHRRAGTRRRGQAGRRRSPCSASPRPACRR